MHTKTDAYGALNLTTTYFYDPVGNRTQINDAENRNTYYDYDDLNRLWWVHDAMGGDTYYGYDKLGNKISVRDANQGPSSHLTWYYYDTLNRLKKVRNPLGMETTYDYDKVGNRKNQWDAKGQQIHYDYDDLNRLTLRTFVGTGVSIGYGYDAAGNRTSMADSREWMDGVEYVYDVLNRLTYVIYAQSEKTIHYGYDNNGNRTSMLDAEAGETVYHYDGLNRLDYLDDPDEGRTNYVYDAGSRLTDMTYPNGVWTHYTYDEANRITGMVTKNSSQQVIQSISYPENYYDKVGNRKRMVVNGTDTTTYGYDALYRLTNVTYPDESTEAYEYDAVGNRLRKRVNGAVTEQYGYNEANQLKTRQTSGSGTPTKEITVTGTVSDPEVGEEINPGYPPVWGIESVTVNGVEATVEEGSFTAEGVVLQRGENTISSVAKDVAGNTSTHNIAVTYDPNITSSYAYVYDNNGNMTTMTKEVDGQDDEVTQYEYDFENRMTKVILPNETTNEFGYDGDKRRVSSKNAAGTVTRFLYDGINNLKDYDEDWEPIASYTQGIGIDKLIRRKDSNGARYYHGDALGSTRMMTNAAEATTASYSYDAWGKITLQSGEAANKHKFTAREWDSEINLQYNRARFYDPEIGRFVTQDPLTKGPDDPTITYYSGVYSIVHRYLKDYVDALEPHKTNRYTYCYNNPVNKIDPLGLQADDDKVKGVGEAAKAEQKGDTKAEEAGKSDKTGTEQKGKTSEDVKGREGVQKEGSDKSGVDKGDTKSDHRESFTVTEAGDKILTISEGGKSYAINLGNNPNSFGGKHDTQVASGGAPGRDIPAGVKGAAVGVLEGLATGAADTGLEKGARGAAQALGKAGAIGIAAEGAHRAYDIANIARDSDTRLSRAERASLASLEISGGAITVLGGMGGAYIGGAIGTLLEGGVPGPGTAIGAVIGGALGGAGTAVVVDGGIKEQTEKYRWNP